MYKRDEKEFISYLKSIVENIDDNILKGISKQVIAKGLNTLSEKQRFVFESGISEYVMDRCPECREEITFEDMSIAIYDGKCALCNFRQAKLEKE